MQQRQTRQPLQLQEDSNFRIPHADNVALLQIRAAACARSRSRSESSRAPEPEPMSARCCLLKCIDKGFEHVTRYIQDSESTIEKGRQVSFGVNLTFWY